MSNGRVYVNERNDEGLTALHIASREGRLNIVMYTVDECKAHINVKDIHDETPLYNALSNKNLEVARFLLGNEANYEDLLGEESGLNEHQQERLRDLINEVTTLKYKGIS